MTIEWELRFNYWALWLKDIQHKMIYDDFISPLELVLNFLFDRTCQFPICWIWVIYKMPMMNCNPFTIIINVQCIWCTLAHRRMAGGLGWSSYTSQLPDASLLVLDYISQLCCDRECAYWWGFTQVWGICSTFRFWSNSCLWLFVSLRRMLSSCLG